MIIIKNINKIYFSLCIYETLKIKKDMVAIDAKVVKTFEELGFKLEK